MKTKTPAKSRILEAVHGTFGEIGQSIPAHGRAFVFRTAIGDGLAVGVSEQEK